MNSRIFSKNIFLQICERRYSMKFKSSIINYKQMPDIFYNYKKRNLPSKIFTAALKESVTMSMSDRIARFMSKYQYDYDISFPAMWLRLVQYRLGLIKQMQTIPAGAVEELGVDLCVAHLVVHMGGSIKLVGHPDWIGASSPSLGYHEPSRWTAFSIRQRSCLPRERVRDFYVEAIDWTGALVTFEGLEYIPSLTKLKTLVLRNAPLLDDPCLRRISRQRRILQHLDLSNCPQITSKGLATLWTMWDLKTLALHGNPLMEDKELVCLLLAEKLPQLQITGVDYLAGLEPQQRAVVQRLIDQSTDQSQISDQSTNQSNLSKSSSQSDGEDYHQPESESTGDQSEFKKKIQRPV